MKTGYYTENKEIMLESRNESNFDFEKKRKENNFKEKKTLNENKFE